MKNKINENITILNQYVPIVARVHGTLHPEFKEVKRIYNDIYIKVQNNDTDLSNEFKSLREITNNYLVPTDVCESYEKVYELLYELDNFYSTNLWWSYKERF